MPNTRLVCQGFTNAAWLATPGTLTVYKKISFTSFSCTFNNTIIQSQAAMGFANSVTKIRRTKGPFIQDVPKIDLSIEFELGRELLHDIIYAILNKRNEKFRIKFVDNATNILWEFKECYFTNFSFSVNGDSILSVSMSFFVRIDEINYEWGVRDPVQYGTDNYLPVQTQGSERAVIPYYDFSLRYKNGQIYDVMNFDFSMSQSVEPKYECSGSKKKFAPSADYLLIGLPEFEFSFTSFMGGVDDRVKYYENYGKNIDGTPKTFHDKISEMDNDSIEIYVRNQNGIGNYRLLKLTGCQEISETPTPGAFPSVNRKFIVDGVMK